MQPVLETRHSRRSSVCFAVGTRINGERGARAEFRRYADSLAVDAKDNIAVARKDPPGNAVAVLFQGGTRPKALDNCLHHDG